MWVAIVRDVRDGPGGRHGHVHDRKHRNTDTPTSTRTHYEVTYARASGTTETKDVTAALYSAANAGMLVGSAFFAFVAWGFIVEDDFGYEWSTPLVVRFYRWCVEDRRRRAQERR